jgi:hypothetical protein
MNCLAIDIGTHCGWACSADAIRAGTWTLCDAKEVKKQKALRMNRRCDIRIPRLWRHVAEIHGLTPLNWIFFEDVEFVRSTMQAHLWAGLRSVLWLFAEHNQIQIECIPVGTLKAFGSGYGAADKNLMARAAVSRYPDLLEVRDQKIVLKLNGAELDDNAIDAIHILKWGLQTTARL